MRFDAFAAISIYNDVIWWFGGLVRFKPFVDVFWIDFVFFEWFDGFQTISVHFSRFQTVLLQIQPFEAFRAIRSISSHFYVIPIDLMIINSIIRMQSNLLFSKQFILCQAIYRLYKHMIIIQENWIKCHEKCIVLV